MLRFEPDDDNYQAQWWQNATSRGTATTVTLAGGVPVTGINPNLALWDAPTAPDVPTSLTATTSNQQARLAWAAPADDGGSAINNYRIQYSVGGGAWTTFAHGASSATSATVTGLTNGSSYRFRVAAINGSGTGGNSAVTDPVTPQSAVAQVPAAPTGLVATAGNGSATVAFTPGSSNGAAITNYQYSTNGGVTWTAFSPAITTSPVTITGLPNDADVAFRLRAVNSVGAGVASATSNVVRPTAPVVPPAPPAPPAAPVRQALVGATPPAKAKS